MAERARKQLEKAQYFLGLAETNELDRSLFALNLEAFVAFARSVIHVLKEESEEAEVWTCFKPEWDALGQETLPEFFRKTRDAILKRGESPDPRAAYTVSLSAGLYAVTGFEASFVVTRADGTVEVRPASPPAATEPPVPKAPKPEAPAQSVRYHFANGALKDQDVIIMCHRYVSRLEQAIAAAEKCGA